MSRAAACIIMPDGDPSDFDMAALVRFWLQHGLVGTVPRRREHLPGGMWTYCDRFQDWFRARGGEVLCGSRVCRITRTAGAVSLGLLDAEGYRDFRAEHVVLAVEASQVAGLLPDADDDERRALASLRWASADVVVHRDSRLLAADPRDWAAYNFYASRQGETMAGPRITFYPHRLAAAGAPGVFVSVNPPIEPRTSLIIAQRRMVHPVAVPSRQFDTLQGRRRTWFAGSYLSAPHLHEQAFQAGHQIARDLMDSTRVSHTPPSRGRRSIDREATRHLQSARRQVLHGAFESDVPAMTNERLPRVASGRLLACDIAIAFCALPGNVLIGATPMSQLGRITLALVLLAAVPVHGQVPGPERQALLDLHAASNGAGWTQSAGWTGPAGTECTWFGITCNGGRVIVIGLQGNNLTGTLAPVSVLTELVQLNVRNNQLTGTLPTLTGMTRLAFFQVSGNQFSGGLPALTGLSALHTFEAGDNQLTGTIPSLAGLGSLTAFLVGGNHLTGPLPSLAGLSSLSRFDASDNQLTGGVPSLATPANLALLLLSSNQLSGPIPQDIALAPRLQNFSASNNALTGSIPDLVGARLEVLIIDNNLLSGPIPDLSEATFLRSLWASGNQLTGPLPTFADSPQLELLRVSDNALSGPVPDLSAAIALRGLRIDGNQIVGTMPEPPPGHNLQPGFSRLCPNPLVPTPSSAWDVATSQTPWFSTCTAVDDTIFADGFDQPPTDLIFADDFEQASGEADLHGLHE